MKKKAQRKPSCGRRVSCEPACAFGNKKGRADWSRPARDLLVKRPRNPKQEQLHLGFTVNKITCNTVYRTEESKGVSDMLEWRFQNAREQRSARSCENIN